MIFSVISKIKDGFGTHATEQVENREVGQKTVTLNVYENNSPERYLAPEDAVLLGTCNLYLDGKLPKHTEICVSFYLMEDGTLKVEGVESRTKAAVETRMNSSALLDETELSLQKQEIERIKTNNKQK